MLQSTILIGCLFLFLSQLTSCSLYKDDNELTNVHIYLSNSLDQSPHYKDKFFFYFIFCQIEWQNADVSIPCDRMLALHTQYL
ncbi:hypothetical protein F5B22DRAFT_302708 [Xylaria bambusicola]|uniref:uncharacterized protein n=1 Tax=Xylaria bambusicola TaxID=326684 RepID=UPI002008E3B4|nr:uncharacterized protein F5B22DRAFT_302708 [Xylaria bambusicola]KAI0512696.1 hypothetical protein F5B22DRAFT_302708 [Xylaria bambusicola]